jgi:SAM-dependent methyltransferase
VGIDIDKPGVQEMTGKGYNVLLQDALEMDLGKRFDTIVAGELIEHLSDPGRFLERCLPQLKPRGIVVLTTPNPFSAMYMLMYLKNFTRAFNPEHTLWLCPQTLRQLAERCGFQVTRTFFVDDLRSENVTSHWYRIFTLVYRIGRVLLPSRLSNTILAVLEPR